MPQTTKKVVVHGYPNDAKANDDRLEAENALLRQQLQESKDEFAKLSDDLKTELAKMKKQLQVEKENFKKLQSAKDKELRAKLNNRRNKTGGAPSPVDQDVLVASLRSREGELLKHIGLLEEHVRSLEGELGLQQQQELARSVAEHILGKEDCPLTFTRHADIRPQNLVKDGDGQVYTRNGLEGWLDGSDPGWRERRGLPISPGTRQPMTTSVECNSPFRTERCPHGHYCRNAYCMWSHGEEEDRERTDPMSLNEKLHEEECMRRSYYAPPCYYSPL